MPTLNQVWFKENSEKLCLLNARIDGLLGDLAYAAEEAKKQEEEITKLRLENTVLRELENEVLRLRAENANLKTVVINALQ